MRFGDRCLIFQPVERATQVEKSHINICIMLYSNFQFDTATQRKKKKKKKTNTPKINYRLHFIHRAQGWKSFLATSKQVSTRKKQIHMFIWIQSGRGGSKNINLILDMLDDGS